MATQQDDKEPNRTGLEGLSESELLERFFDEFTNYKCRLSKEDSSNPHVAPFNKRITEEYREKTKELRAEIDRREQLYLKYHNSFIEH